jgi:cyanate lyase
VSGRCSAPTPLDIWRNFRYFSLARSSQSACTRRSAAMTKQEMSDSILAAKKARGMSWGQLASKLGLAPIYVASCCYGENSMAQDAARALGELLSLPSDVVDELSSFPLKGNSMGGKLVPTDPLIYRFYEIMAVYGMSLKDVIQEQCGDGIMSAIDFTMDVKRVEDPKGDRIVVTMNGKFLPYKKW